MKKRNKDTYSVVRESSHVAVGILKPLENMPESQTLFISTNNDPQTALADEEEINAIKNFFVNNPNLKSDKLENLPEKVKDYALPGAQLQNYSYDPDEPWIQTYSGLRFTPLNPNIESINIIDIAHALSMKCRFAGHSKKYYSVAQHCVLVSYLCDEKDRKHGLLHDASEAYLIDLPSPLKRSGVFDNFIKYENELQKTIYSCFDLSEIEPKSVKDADICMLYTEERDLFNVHRSDWVKGEPAPFTIKPLPPQEAKDLFMKRFYELTGNLEAYYDDYIKSEYNL